ncbi:MAG: SufBD protein [Clostridiales bacterium]|nr:SufBD protein [Roseburia sp.]MDD7637079.1 SufBD protein [Clostridiales bacterium]MDY4113810.1 SufBD protein [Roseburia sp.]
MKEYIISELTSKNDKYACAIADKIISESKETDKWYEYFDDFAVLLSHTKSLVRNRAFCILAANIKWDDENRFDVYLEEYLSHITDEKPISARQCIKSLAQIGKSKDKYIPSILEAFQNADLSKYKDSMRPLIEKDIEEVKNIFTA